MLHRKLPLAVACALLLLVGVLVTAAAMPTASATNDCDLVLRPAAGFEVMDPSGRTFSIIFELDQTSEETVLSSKTGAGGFLDAQGFDEASKAAVFEYLDSLLAWLRYVAAPCAPAAIYEGPYTNRPASTGSPYGFGGIDVSAGPAVVMIVTGPEGDAEVEVGRVVVADDSHLAHSGSESFVLAYFGAGLLAFGATALGMRRWMSGPVDDHGG